VDTARHLTRAKALTARLSGVGPVTALAMTARLGRAVLRWALYQAGKVHARSCAPDHSYYAQVKDRKDGKRAALSEARKIVRQGCRILAELGDDALSVA
jgi:transposase